MKNDKLLIQDVTLARCGEGVNNISQISGDKVSYIQLVEFIVDKTITCVVNKEKNVAIDIETCKVWEIPKRDNNNRIIGDISFGQLYPVLFNDKNWDDISYMYQLSLKARAKKVYQRYLENMEIEKNNKIKTKTKEN